MKIELAHRDGAVAYDCAPGERILLAGLRAGHGLPHECGTGTCGTCKASLVEGRVADAWPQAPGRKHLKEGEVLLCQVAAESDCKVSVRGRLVASSAPRADSLTGTLQSVTPLNADVLKLEIVPERPIAFEPGQFMLVRVPEVPGYRGWSMARFERPGKKLVFTVKLMPKGSVSGWLAAKSRAGTPVELFGPMGRAFFKPGEDKNLLCIAGGSGLAPMLAILEGAVMDGHLDRFRADLFFGVRRVADLYAMDELMALRDRAPGLALTVALSEEAPGREATMRCPNVTFASGFVHVVAGHAMVQRYADVTAFLAGPPVMVDAAMRMLITEAKLPAKQIRYDKFS